MISLTLAACLTVAPLGVCRAEMADAAQRVIPPPAWATDAWIEFAAHIVASEARNVPSADLAVACTLVWDVERGWQPWMLRGRWFGWGEPDEGDREAVVQAVLGGCSDVPRFVYVGNLNDLRHWRAVGMVGDGPFVLYIGNGGSAVVGVPERSEIKVEVTGQ